MESESGRGSILDQMGSWQSDRDLNNLTIINHMCYLFAVRFF